VGTIRPLNAKSDATTWDEPNEIDNIASMAQESVQTIFELGFRSFPWASVSHTLVVLPIGLLLMRFPKSKRFALVGVLMVSVALFFFLISLVAVVPDFLKQRSAYLSGKNMIVEGVVQDFRPAPLIGPARESFSVDGVPFSYYAGANTPCFDDAPFHKGPIREGLDVRIRYYEGCIQRIDILQKVDPKHESTAKP